jgi:hypothetical protein
MGVVRRKTDWQDAQTGLFYLSDSFGLLRSTKQTK